MKPASEVVGAVLAGGESRRMGTDKARLELDGRSLGARAVNTLRSRLDRVVVVSRRLGDHPELGAPEISDRLPGEGPLGGLHAALEHAAGLPVFALACDLPLVGPELVAYLLERGLSEIGLGDEARAVVPKIGGRLQPLCGLYSAGCRAEIEQRLARGDRRVVDLVASIDSVCVAIGPDLSFYRRDLLDNVNDPGSAARLGARSAAPEGKPLRKA